MKARRRPKELFLSHSDKDRKLAAKLARMLQADGVRVWYSRKDLRGADVWHREIGRALERCDWMIVLLSRSSVRSIWVERELVRALSSPRYHGHIIPVISETCDADKLSWTLGGMQHIDLRSGIVLGYRDLLAVWGLSVKPRRRKARHG